MEDYPAEFLVNSAEHSNQVINEVQNITVETPLSTDTRRFSYSNTETSALSESSIVASEDTSVEHGSINVGTSNRGKFLSESKELVPPHQVSTDHSHDESYRDSSTAASTSFKEHQSSDPVSVNVSTNKDAGNGIDNSVDRGIPQICPEVHSCSSSPQDIGDSSSGGVSAENGIGEVAAVHNSDSDSVPHDSNVSATSRSLGDESFQDAIPSGLGFLVSNGEQGWGDGSVLQVDVVTISSNIISRSNADESNREVRRNSRRLFWDAFSRRSSRRHSDSPTILFSTDDSENLGSHDRWLLDLSGELFDDGVGGDRGYLGNRIHSLNERRRNSRSEIWERLRGSLDDSGRRNTTCPSGLHPDGTCSCESVLTNEESSTRASISRIVMLAEALFEVLDEIHRQPVSLSLSMVSLPAPESVVDSFPLKSHKKVNTSESCDVEQCYICLAEYEEGDKIRVLPCHHEYHMSCVDKWLKEIHGVCPLCRGDVREGFTESSVSGSEIPSL
ncbi:E3 ubiquitin ligase BIG BROTHER-related-like isoform X2 [Alnus glutinosa]|nr:E3 ubiquitin ligase BIG BROTHER-related-like isoform X2 [Alnus glutinosa]